MSDDTLIVKTDSPTDAELHQVEAEQPGKLGRREPMLGSQDLGTKP